MPNIVAVCAMYHLDEMNKMLKIATSQAEDLGYNIVDVIEVPGCMDMAACNYTAEANVDDGSCYSTGDACDDMDEGTQSRLFFEVRRPAL